MNLIGLILVCSLGFQVTPPEQNARCLLCHGRPDFGITIDQRFESLYVRPDDFARSVHGRMTCQTCHYDVRVLPHLRRPQRIHCLQCHYAGNVVGAPVTERPERYKESIHARARERGDLRAPDCKDCHGIHDVLPPTHPASPVHKVHVPETCGRCHTRQLQEYRTSIHAEGLARGVLAAPACIDCHREHDILPPEDLRSSLNPRNVVATCSRCHADVRIARIAGVPVRQVEAFRESFHGIYLEFGELRAANCTSCHGYHQILPSTDPRSPTHPTNLPRTCGKCHPNANENVARGKIHVVPSEPSSGPVYYVYIFYKWAIALTILALSAHVLLDLLGHFRKHRNRRRHRRS